MVGDSVSFFKKNISVLSFHVLIRMQSLLLIPIIIKTSGAATYGAYALLISLTAFIFGVSSLGVGYRCKRLLPSIDAYKERIRIFFSQFTFQLITLSILTLILIYLYPKFDEFFFKGEFELQAWILLPFLLIHLIYSQLTDYFRYTHRIKIFNYATVAQPYLFILYLLLYWSIYDKIDVSILIISTLASSFLVAIVLIYLALKEIGFKLQLSPISDIYKDMRLGFPLTLSYIVDVIIAMSDRYVIAAFIGVSAVGYYIPAYTIGMLIIVLAKVFGVVLPPMVSRSIDSGDNMTSEKIINISIKVYLIASIPFVVGSLMFSKQILALFTTPEIADQAYIITPIVAFGALFYGLQLIISNVLFVTMKTKLMFKVNFYVAMLNLILNIILLYLFKEIVIAAITTTISYIFSLMYIFPKVNRFWKISIDWIAVYKAIFNSIIMGFFLFWYISLSNGEAMYGVADILIGVLSSMLLYIVLSVVTKILTKKEWSF